MGFTKLLIPDDEARGVSVLSRGKLVQAPFYFDLSGGAYGQHGMQYMTGEVQADFLDDAVDLIATDRASVLWGGPAPVRSSTGARGRSRSYSRVGQRSTKGERATPPDTTPHFDRLENFPEREREELRAAIPKLASIDTSDDARSRRTGQRPSSWAYENETFMRADPGDQCHRRRRVQEELLRLFQSGTC